MLSKWISLGISLALVTPLAQAQMDDDPHRHGSGFVEQFDVPQEIVDLQIELRTLRQTLGESREAALAELAEDATMEERMAAIEAWEEANQEDLDLARSLRDQLKDELEAYRPPHDFAIPEEVAGMRDELKASREALRDSRKAAIEALGEDATEEEIRAAIEAWKVENADAIAASRALAEELRSWFRENRPPRPDRGMSAEMKALRDQFKAQADELHARRTALRESLQNPDLTKEEREQMIADFREEYGELMREIKELRRNQRRGGGDNLGGDRRPGG